MVRVKPFAALRPPKDIVGEVAAPPYDVLSSVEAARLAGEKSLLHISRPEIDFSPIASEDEPRCFERCASNFAEWQKKGWLRKDPRECYYLYELTMQGRSQLGIILCANTEDYRKGVIKRNELTREDKENNRKAHIALLNANLGPALYAFRDNKELEGIMAKTAQAEPEYDFTDENGVNHRLWVMDDSQTIETVTGIFASSVDAFYIADGHHRSAAAVRVCEERRKANPAHDGSEEYNWMLAVCFPESQLRIMDYNRVVEDLNGLNAEEFLSRLEDDFVVECKGSEACRPDSERKFSMYLEGQWYSLSVKNGRCAGDDPVQPLDASLLNTLVLDAILGIKDLRHDRRIDFVGGVRGLSELKARVDSGEMKVAFALFPVSMRQLMTIADNSEVMPPKTTWFEPKLRSGLAIHSLI